MNRVAIEAGEYLAVTDVVVSEYTGNQQLTYREIPAGRQFTITVGSGHIAREYVTYSPDFGDRTPKYTRIGS